jgi:hypothetical protein
MTVEAGTSQTRQDVIREGKWYWCHHIQRWQSWRISLQYPAFCAVWNLVAIGAQKRTKSRTGHLTNMILSLAAFTWVGCKTAWKLYVGTASWPNLNPGPLKHRRVAACYTEWRWWNANSKGPLTRAATSVLNCKFRILNGNEKALWYVRLLG